jgi:hypothetical protein
VNGYGEIIPIAHEYGALRVALPAPCELEVSTVPGEPVRNIGILSYDQPIVPADKVLGKRADP